MIESDPSVDRSKRRFLGGASLLGAASLVLPFSGAAAQGGPGLCTAGSIPADRTAPPDPGLKQGDLLDNRYAVTYQRSIPAAVSVLTEHFAALSARDLDGIANTLHFPFAVHEQFTIRMPVVVRTRQEFMANPPASVGITLTPVRFERDSWLREGLYDVLVGIEVIHFNPVMCNLAMTYDRYDENGKLVHRCEGVYLVTNNDGRWAIEVFSTIFTPAQNLGVEWPDALAIAYRPRMDHVLGIWDDDYDILPNKTRHNTYPRVSVSGGGIGNMTDAANSNPMNPFNPSGVVSRLNIQEGPSPNQGGMRRDPNQTRWDRVQGGFQEINKGERGGSTTKMRDARVLHHNSNKIHVIHGVERWNTSGEELSVTQQIGIISYKEGRWARDMDLGYYNTHARINDIPAL